MSTIKALQHIVRLAKHGIETSGHYYACFIDFERAFDRVDRNLPFEKLFCRGYKEESSKLSTLFFCLIINISQVEITNHGRYYKTPEFP